MTMNNAERFRAAMKEPIEPEELFLEVDKHGDVIEVPKSKLDKIDGSYLWGDAMIAKFEKGEEND